MELGISSDFDEEFRKISEIERSLRQISEAGFSHVHWCYEWNTEYIYSHAEMEQIKNWLKKYNLKAKSLHASAGYVEYDGHLQREFKKDYVSMNEYNRIAGVELVKNRVDLAAMLGTTEIVLHMWLPYLDFKEIPGAKEQFYTQAFRSLDELQPYCKEKNVRICIENIFSHPGEYQQEQFEKFDRLFERYPADFLGLCLDTGHGYLVWGNDFITKFVDRYKERLYSIHIHDNWGWRTKEEEAQGLWSDAHVLPGEGNIDWPALTEVLKQSAYRGPWVLEVVNGKKEDPAAYLKRAHEAGERILSGIL